MPEKKVFWVDYTVQQRCSKRNLPFGKEQQKRRRKTSGIRHPENEGRN